MTTPSSIYAKHMPDPEQQQNPPAHVPDPMQP